MSGAVQQAATTYNNGYTYGAPQPFGQNAGPHAPTGVGPATTLTYDRDGNQTQYSGTFGPSRSLTWTEDDRLRSETDSGFTNQFLYDSGGTRTHKRRTTLETWYVNANYVVKNSLTESKHIMLGDQRIVTAVATIPNRADPKTAGANTLFYYHPDHIQSTSYVTGGDGSILQHDEYFPSGEVWFQEQKNNDARNTQPYLFNAKELDETGPVLLWRPLLQPEVQRLAESGSDCCQLYARLTQWRCIRAEKPGSLLVRVEQPSRTQRSDGAQDRHPDGGRDAYDTKGTRPGKRPG